MEALPKLATSILTAMESPAVIEFAGLNLLVCKTLGLTSDWDQCPEKVIAFSRLCAAASTGSGRQTTARLGRVFRVAVTPEASARIRSR